MTKIHKVGMGFVNCFLLETEKDCILIDAGYKNKENKLWKYLEKNAIDPKRIKLIIITHGHLDHVGSLVAIKEKTGAKVLIHEIEGKLLREGNSPRVKPTVWLMKKLYNTEKETKVDAVEPDILISDEFSLEEYGVNGKVIHTPGHTSGSISVILDSKYAFVGDIAMKIPLLSGSSYIPIIADDIEEVYDSWQKIVDEGVEIMYPAHGKTLDVRVFEKELQKKNK